MTDPIKEYMDRRNDPDDFMQWSHRPLREDDQLRWYMFVCTEQDGPRQEWHITNQPSDDEYMGGEFRELHDCTQKAGWFYGTIYQDEEPERYVCDECKRYWDAHR